MKKNFVEKTIFPGYKRVKKLIRFLETQNSYYLANEYTIEDFTEDYQEYQDYKLKYRDYEEFVERYLNYLDQRILSYRFPDQNNQEIIVRKAIKFLFNEFFRLNHEGQINEIRNKYLNVMKGDDFSFFYPTNLQRYKKINLFDYLFVRVKNKHHKLIKNEIYDYDWKKIFENHPDKDLLGVYNPYQEWSDIEKNYFIKEEIKNEIVEQPYEIVLYLKTIDKCAKDLHIRTEDLIYVVLTHEIAHFFTHQGRYSDCISKIWNTDYFKNAGSDLKESIAQYYTLKSLEYVSKDHELRNPKFKPSFYHLNAFMALYNVQHKTYRQFVENLGFYSTSSVSAALKTTREKESFNDDSKSKIYYEEFLIKVRNIQRIFKKSSITKTFLDLIS